MRWEGRRQSKNVEDRRSQGAAPMMVGGGLLTLILMIALMFLGVDPMQVARMAPEIAAPAPQKAPAKPQNDELSQFVRVVLADNEDVWSRLFPPNFSGRYAPPTLVLFTGQVRSACGMRAPRPAPFTARSTRRCTSTSRFTTNSSGGSALPETSLRPT